MTEEKKTPAKKSAASTKKAAAPKAEKKTTTAAPKSKKPAGKTVTVRQIGSPIGRPDKQRHTLIGLGLNKMHKTRVLEDTPAVRGMVNAIPHLVEIVEEAA